VNNVTQNNSGCEASPLGASSGWAAVVAALGLGARLQRRRARRA
jgi:hypothetical protein